MSKKHRKFHKRNKYPKKKKANKWVLGIIFLLIIFFLLFLNNAFSLETQDSSSTEKGLINNLKNFFSSLNFDAISKNSNLCEQEARKLVSARISINTFLIGNHGDETGYDLLGVTFKDGISGEYNAWKNYCRPGSKKGELKNHCYIEGPNIKYSKKVVKEGIVLGDNKFELDNIVLIIPPLMDTGRGWSQRDSNFPIYSYEVKNCKWVEEIEEDKKELPKDEFEDPKTNKFCMEACEDTKIYGEYFETSSIHPCVCDGERYLYDARSKKRII